MINSCVKETFCIYTIDPKVNSIDPKSNWIKVGYGDIYRPGSSDYFTGFGIDCDVTLWKFDNILKNDCYIIEQDIHKYIKHNNITVGAAGIECYISSKEKMRINCKLYNFSTRYFQFGKIRISPSVGKNNI